MTAMLVCRGAFNEAPHLQTPPSGRFVLDRHVLSVGAAQRRARAQEVEAEMDMACERAAVGSELQDGSRDQWSKQAWDRYVAEAVNQARAHGDELQALWRDAAHLDLGFWTEYFTSTAGKVEFIEQVMQWPCYSDPAHTLSDAEREIQRRLRQVDLLGLYRKASRTERETAERAEFTRLKARFEPDGIVSMDGFPQPKCPSGNILSCGVGLGSVRV